MGSKKMSEDTGGEKKEKTRKPGFKAPEKKRKDVPADVRLIVRVAGKDLDGSKTVPRALAQIKGVGLRMAQMMSQTFEKKTGQKPGILLGRIPETADSVLESIVINPVAHGIPVWTLNHQKEFFSGENRHLVMSDLEFGKRTDLQRLNEIKSYRGLRLQWGLPVRGQRTRSTHRGKGPVVGVIKKEATAAAEPARK
ncbi:MAG: 30S ribosomal protein S13 [Candidatus Diapherotrites archaeon]|nr:30S ribosomal protein S13 [Candidatus Diapherotrites archaeon]